MNHSTSRRQFLATTSAATLGMLTANHSASAAPFKTTLHRAKIVGLPTEQILKEMKEAGFEGVEASAIIPEDEAKKVREMAEKMGMRIHSVLRGWASFNGNSMQVIETAKLTENAIIAAHGYGADDILLVPCRIGGMKMPNAWEFKVKFDEKTGQLKEVVEGDNAPYKEYIDAHNHAQETSFAAVQKLIPLAEKLNIIIGLENVWNNLWVDVHHYKQFVSSFNHPLVKAYYDVGNHVKYLNPVENWVRTLGKLICKVHIKDYKLTPDHKGEKFVHPRDGSINWPEVRKAFDEVGYNGWLSIEDGGLPLPEFKKRIDDIIEGR